MEGGGQAIAQARAQVEHEVFMGRVLVGPTPRATRALTREHTHRKFVVVAALHLQQIDEVNGLAEVMQARTLLEPILRLARVSVMERNDLGVVALFDSPMAACEGVAMCVEALRRHNGRDGVGKGLAVGFGMDCGDVVIVPGWPAEVYGPAPTIALSLAKHIASANEILVTHSVAIDVGALAHQLAEGSPLLSRVACTLHSLEGKHERSVTVLRTQGVKVFQLAAELNTGVPRFRTFARSAKSTGQLLRPVQAAEHTEAFGFEALALMYGAAESAIAHKQALALEAFDIRNALVTRFTREVVIVVVALPFFESHAEQHGIASQLCQVALQRALLRPVIAEHAGTLRRVSRDQMWATFATARAAVGACQAALAALSDHNACTSNSLDQLVVSIGVHTGVVFEHKNELFGYDVIVAEWLCEGLAHHFASPGASSRVHLDESMVDEECGVELSKVTSVEFADLHDNPRAVYTLPPFEAEEPNRRASNAAVPNRRSVATLQLSKAQAMVLQVMPIPKRKSASKKGKREKKAKARTWHGERVGVEREASAASGREGNGVLLVPGAGLVRAASVGAKSGALEVPEDRGERTTRSWTGNGAPVPQLVVQATGKSPRYAQGLSDSVLKELQANGDLPYNDSQKLSDSVLFSDVAPPASEGDADIPPPPPSDAVVAEEPGEAPPPPPPPPLAPPPSPPDRLLVVPVPHDDSHSVSLS